MRRYNSSFLAFTLVGLSALLFQACRKDNSASPRISGVRAALANPNDSTLSLVNPGQYVILDGAGLMSTEQVLFDGVPATYNAALTADQHLVIQVPNITPEALSGPKANTIEIISSRGNTVFQFPVDPPAPVVTSISNEFAHPGDVITINGQFLFLIQAVVFPGGVAATGYTTTDAGTTLTVTVPAGATTGGGILITSKGGTSSSEPAAGFRDTRGMLCNFDDVNQYSWGALGVIDSATFLGHEGYFAQMGFFNSTVIGGDENWYSGNRSVNTNGVQWVATDSMSNPIGDYALKFEVYAKIPWTAGSIWIVPNYTWTYLAPYATWKLNADSTLTSTTQWTTAVVPLTSFQTGNGAGTPAGNLATLLGASGNTSISLMFINDGTKTMTNMDIGVDNIRVVKIK
ncbi:MAG TPA: glycan-binding surface protein [Dinghuibacter sp.]|uniref:glycan-binding surface protein n=1 Tax=Dinghuibacter sp. TaxID=2024697 RepID=UPI002D00F001|nr:glycan-binding surface protein [Dinghuibacter sp.]HTJ14711.1 glycan-binding surface protein [Dinghuibacter sp.]